MSDVKPWRSWMPMLWYALEHHDSRIARAGFEWLYREKRKKGISLPTIGECMRVWIRENNVPFRVRDGILSSTPVDDCITHWTPDSRLVDTPHLCLLDMLHPREISKYLEEQSNYIKEVSVKEKNGDFSHIPSATIERRFMTDILYLESKGFAVPKTCLVFENIP